jgi:hypothetical protein
MTKYYVLITLSLFSMYSTALTAVDCLSGNCENGKGATKYKDAQYVGDFKNSKPNGSGTYMWTDGSAYIGEFQNGYPNGKGEYLWPNGWKFVGLFKDGQPSGKGKLIDKENKATEVEYSQGAIVSTDKNPESKAKLEEFASTTKTEVRQLDAKATDPNSNSQASNQSSDVPFWKKKFSFGGLFSSKENESEKKATPANNSSASKGSKGGTGFSLFETKPFLKSAIIPGWTQWDNGEKLKGGIFFGSFFLTGGLLYQWDKTYTSRKKDYDRATNNFILYPNDLGLAGIGYLNAQNSYDKFQKVAGESRMLSIGLVAIYLVNVVDAIFFSKPVGTAFQESEGLHFYTEQFRIDTQFIDSKYNLQYTWRF